MTAIARDAYLAAKNAKSNVAAALAMSISGFTESELIAELSSEALSAERRSRKIHYSQLSSEALSAMKMSGFSTTVASISTPFT